MKWFLVRHGEIASNLKRVYAGRSDELLTETGIRQAEAAGRKLLNHRVEAVYASPLRRTIQTAKIIGKIIGTTPIIEDCFIEQRLGPWEGLQEAVVASLFPGEWEIWNKSPADLCLPGRETLHDLQRRVLEGIRRIGNVRNRQSVAVVTHVSIIRVLILHARGMDLNAYRTIPIPENAAIMSLDGNVLMHEAAF